MLVFGTSADALTGTDHLHETEEKDTRNTNLLLGFHIQAIDNASGDGDDIEVGDNTEYALCKVELSGCDVHPFCIGRRPPPPVPPMGDHPGQHGDGKSHVSQNNEYNSTPDKSSGAARGGENAEIECKNRNFCEHGADVVQTPCRHRELLM